MSVKGTINPTSYFVVKALVQIFLQHNGSVLVFYHNTSFILPLIEAISNFIYHGNLYSSTFHNFYYWICYKWNPENLRGITVHKNAILLIFFMENSFSWSQDASHTELSWPDLLASCHNLAMYINLPLLPFLESNSWGLDLFQAANISFFISIFCIEISTKSSQNYQDECPFFLFLYKTNRNDLFWFVST